MFPKNFLKKNNNNKIYSLFNCEPLEIITLFFTNFFFTPWNSHDYSQQGCFLEKPVDRFIDLLSLYELTSIRSLLVPCPIMFTFGAEIERSRCEMGRGVDGRLELVF